MPKVSNGNTVLDKNILGFKHIFWHAINFLLQYSTSILTKILESVNLQQVENINTFMAIVYDFIATNSTFVINFSRLFLRRDII